MLLILFLNVLQICLITADSIDNSKFVRKNNYDLYKCLSSSLSLSTRIIYPCNTLANQNNSQYQCIHFNATNLSSIRGGRISHSPVVIVYVKDSSDVQNVIKCATKLNYIVNALGGGHSYEGYGLGSTYNNIIINMERINHIKINRNDKTVRIGAGARIGPIYYKTYQYNNYTVNAGSCAWVGVAGQALGGGFGFLARLHGLLSDSILEIKAVNDRGKLLTINENHEPDLFWALRGGGGGLFVVVTEFKFRLIKSPSLVTRFSAVWDKNATKLVMKRYQSLMFNNTSLSLNRNIYLQMVINNTHINIFMGNFGGKLKEFNKTILVFLKNLPTPNEMNVRKQDWLSFVYEVSGIENPTGDHRQLLLENVPYPTYYFKAKHEFYNRPISDSSLDQLLNQLSSNNGQVILLFVPWDGYISTIPINKTAFPHRNYKFGIQFLAYWNNQQDENKQMNYLKEVYSSIYQDSTKHSYINYIDRDVPEWMDVYYHTHKQRLISIKHIYDKRNRFYFERTIE